MPFTLDDFNREAKLSAMKARDNGVSPEEMAENLRMLADQLDPGGGGAPPEGDEGPVVIIAKYADGAGQIELPEWIKLEFNDLTGDGSIVDGSLHVPAEGAVVVEARAYVLHNWGSAVVFGKSWNGEPVAEFARVTVQSNTPVLVIQRYYPTLESEGTLDMYISSDFPWSEFQWSGGEVDIIKMGARGRLRLGRRG